MTRKATDIKISRILQVTRNPNEEFQQQRN